MGGHQFCLFASQRRLESGGCVSITELLTAKLSRTRTHCLESKSVSINSEKRAIVRPLTLHLGTGKSELLKRMFGRQLSTLVTGNTSFSSCLSDSKMRLRHFNPS